MHRKTTQETANNFANVLKDEKKKRLLNPSQGTLAFVMQFAYSYHVEKKLPSSLSGIMLN